MLTVAADITDSAGEDADPRAVEAVEAVDPASAGDADVTASAGDEESGYLRRFTLWRQRRPFFSGLFMVLAGVVIIVPAYLTVKIMDILVMISSMSGVSTLVIGAALIMFGLGTWFRPTTAVYLGVFAIIMSVIALPTSNFGGFILGTLLGVTGGIGALSWEDKDRESRSDRRERRRQARARRSAARHTQDATTDGAAARVTGLVAAVVLAITVGGVALTSAVQAQESIGPLTAQGTAGTVTADLVTLSGNVTVNIVPVDTVSGTVNAVVLTADELTAEGLGLDIPGIFTGKMRTIPGSVSRLDGGVEAVVSSMSVAPGVVDGPALPVPVPVNLDGGLGEVLTALGIPEIEVPGEVIESVELHQVTMGLISLRAGNGDIPNVTLGY